MSKHKTVSMSRLKVGITIFFAVILIVELILFFVQDLEWSRRAGVEVEERTEVPKKIE
ncbi:MAG: hypothetical protein ABIJ15_05150 [bacterium]